MTDCFTYLSPDVWPQSTGGRLALSPDASILYHDKGGPASRYNYPAITLIDSLGGSDFRQPMTVRGDGDVYFVDLTSTPNYDVYKGWASPTLVGTATTSGGNLLGISWSPFDDQLYIYDSGSSISFPPRLLRMDPDTGSVSVLATGLSYNAPDIFQPACTPDGGVWIITRSGTAGKLYRWDIAGASLSTFLLGENIGGNHTLVPRPDGSVWWSRIFAGTTGSYGKSCSPAGVIAFEPCMTGFDHGLVDVAQTPTLSVVAFTENYFPPSPDQNGLFEMRTVAAVPGSWTYGGVHR